MTVVEETDSSSSIDPCLESAEPHASHTAAQLEPLQRVGLQNAAAKSSGA